MSESEIKLQIPDAYKEIIEDLRLLKRDGHNPNKMTEKQKEQTWQSLSDFGWVYPVVTDKEGVFSDGEQRVDVSISHGEFFGPVLRLPIDDTQRRLLRQVLNKLKGTHDKLLDAQEFRRIKEAGSKEDLQSLLGMTEESFDRYDKLLDGYDKGVAVVLDGSFEVVIVCIDEAEQKRVFEKLKAEGYNVRILTL